MVLQIMKLAIDAAATVTVNPTIDRFFYYAPATVTGPTTLTITVDEFLDDTGAAATELPAFTAPTGYYELFINGVLQMEGISTYTAGATGTGALVITIPADSTLLANSPIVLAVTTFAPTSDVTVET